MKYDTQAIDDVARRIKFEAERVGTARDQKIARALNELPGEYAGKGAKACLEVMTQLSNDVKRAQGELEALSSSLFIFAEQLRQADLKAKEMIERE